MVRWLSERDRAIAHRLRKRVDTAITAVGTDPIDDAKFVGGTFVLSAAIVVGLHIIMASALHHGTTGEVIALVPAVVLALTTLWLLLWTYWQVQRDELTSRPYIVAMLAAFATIGVSIEAFAGVAMVLWQHGMLSAGGDSARLWRAESAFIWHLFDAIPLLGIPAVLRWHEPTLLANHLGGALVLAFKVMLLLPTVRLAISGYKYRQAVHLERMEKRLAMDDRHARYGSRPTHIGWLRGSAPANWVSRLGGANYQARELWLTAAVLVALAVVSTAVLALAGPANRLSHRLPEHLTVGPVTVPLTGVPLGDLLPDRVKLGPVSMSADWLRGALAIVLLLLMLWVYSGLAPSYTEAPPTQPRSRSAYLGAFAACAGFLLAVTTQGALLLIITAHLTLAHPEPVGDISGTAAAEWLAYGGTQAVPALAIPETLHWVPKTSYADRWSGSILLAYRATVVVIIAIVVPKIIVYRTRFGRRPSATATMTGIGGALRAVDSFHDRLIAAQAALTAIVSIVASTGDTKTRDRLNLSFVDLGAVYPHEKALVSAAELAAMDARRIRDLFGPGPVADAAEEALAELEACVALVHNAPILSRHDEPLITDLIEARRRIIDASEKFTRGASEALSEALADVRRQLQRA